MQTLHLEGYSWSNSPNDPMLIEIKYGGELIMRFFLGEAIENAGRKRVLEHVKHCDNTPWLKRWQEEKHQVLIDKLKE